MPYKIDKHRKEPYCVAPFASPAITPDGFKMCSAPCAKSHKDISFWNGDEMKDIRKQWINDEVPDACAECYFSTGGVISSNRVPKEVEVPLNFKNLYIARSNKCDLACEMCSATISHTWDKVWNNGKVGIVENDFDLTDYLHETEVCAISGGNPVLDHKINDIIKGLDNNKIKRFLITTNGSVFPDRMLNNIIEADFKCNVMLIFSIDGPKEFNEKARLGAKQERIYKTINSVIQRTKHVPNIDICIEFTGTNQSIKHLIPLYEEMLLNLPLDGSYNGPYMIANVCAYPEKLAIQNVDKKTWEYMSNDLFRFFIKKNDFLGKQFFSMVNKYCEIVHRNIKKLN